MKTTINIEDRLLNEAIKATGVKQKTAVINLGLQELIVKAARERLINLGGKLKNIKTPRRRRSISAIS